MRHLEWLSEQGLVGSKSSTGDRKKSFRTLQEENMELGFIGLGKMGANMVQRLMDGGHRVIVYDRAVEAVKALEAKGAVAASSLEDMVSKLDKPCAVWIMVPSGDPVTHTIASLQPLMSKGDLIIDGGNSNYKDTISRGKQLSEHGLHYMDVGTSGGIWGLKLGYCMMIGGDAETFHRMEPAFKTLAPEEGYLHAGSL